MLHTVCSSVLSVRSSSQLRLCRSLFLTNVYWKKKQDDLVPFQALPDLANPSLNPLNHADLLKIKVIPKHNADKKILRVAILGTPNSGKSTLVNKMVGQHICPESFKPNTTRRNAKAILTSADTQIVFLDTPGVVEDAEVKKFRMEKTLMLDPELSCSEADLLVVMHDVSNRYVRESLNKKVLRLLCLHYKDVPSILVMNKMDTIPKSRRVYDLIRKLTCNRLDGEEGQSVKISKRDSKRSVEKYLKRKEWVDKEESVKEKSSVVKDDVGELLEIAKNENLSEEKTLRLIAGLLGWPGFRDVFTISALNGDGVEDLKQYLLGAAEPGKWIYPDNVKFDDDPRNIVINIIKSKFLDHLPHQIPYTLKPEIQLWEIDEDWKCLRIMASIEADKNQFKLIVGPKGWKIKALSTDIQESLIDFFSHEVHFKLSVVPTFTTVVQEKDPSTIKPDLFL